MEKLTISIPDQKSDLVKQILKSMGVLIQTTPTTLNSSTYREKLERISTWDEKDLGAFDNAKIAFSNFKAEEW